MSRVLFYFFVLPNKYKHIDSKLNSSLQDTKDSLLKPPNYNDLLTTITPNANGGTETYTATQNCWVCFHGYGYNGKDTKLYIDNKEIASVYSGGSNDFACTLMFYVAKGSVVKIINITIFAYANMKIYATI